MIVIVDERELVKEGYHSLFDREGVASAGFGSSEFGEWVTSAADEDVKSVRAFLIGDCGPDSMLAAQDPRPHRRAGHRAQRTAFAGEHAAAVRVRRRRRRPQAGPHPRDPGPHLGDPPPRQARRDNHLEIGAHAHLHWTAAIPRSTASRCRCRAASAASSNIWRATAAAASPRPRSSTRSTASSTRRSRRTSSRATSASCARSCASKLGYDPIDSKRFLGYRLIVG